MRYPVFMDTSSVSVPKQHHSCEVLGRTWLNREIFWLDIGWAGPRPKAGQFFFIRPERSGVFLGRPISAASWGKRHGPIHRFADSKAAGRATGGVCFMISLWGRGTRELAALRVGETVELTGPLGNAWTDLLPKESRGGRIALIGGGVGIAPLTGLASELPEQSFDLYAGFKTMSVKKDVYEYERLLGPFMLSAAKIVLATEDGQRGKKGLIPAFLNADQYRAVCACGPEPMLKAVAAKCRAAAVPCFISMERRMACGVGACLGCTVPTAQGNRRCCADGPIFPGDEIFFDKGE
jgi:NAD(P)H-flavin reductase